MILSFKTQINGKPTYFVEKIWAGLLIEDYELYRDYLNPDYSFDHNIILNHKSFKPKIHTIREDKNERWKVGMMIDFFINARKKNMFRFAPLLPVVSKQRIFMTYLPQCGLGFRVSINGRELAEDEVEQLAFNDGFEAVEDFEDYFIAQMKNDEYAGRIIHWTNFKY
ncbi:hypothetical protein CMT52_07735 [Elizabethkingia anophelis]|nr:hypothetical protein [Elizabethkingia anophelis]